MDRRSMEEEEERRRSRRNRINSSLPGRKGRIMPERVRPRRVFKPRDGPPPVGCIDVNAFKPQQFTSCYDPMDPAILACLHRLRTGTGPTSGTMHPRSYFSARRSTTTTGYQAQVEGGGTLSQTRILAIQVKPWLKI